ncbi:MAG: CpaF family protein [Chloroflexota bacterium]|nr:CpaF family protein [Chloroflexota bacterium]
MSLLKRLNTEPQHAAPTGPGRAAAPPPLARGAVERNLVEMKATVQGRLLGELGPDLDLSRPDQVRTRVEEIFGQIVTRESIVLTRTEKELLLGAILAELLGFGPLEQLLADDSVSEIMVNGPHHVFVERKGRLERVRIGFEDNDHVKRVIDRIISPLGRRIDESSPMVDARLPDGSRVNAVIPPLALNGPTVTIRKFSRDPLRAENLVGFGSITDQMVTYMRAAVMARLNILVSGGTGSGKTTMLNVLSSFIPEDERIVTIENAAELQLQQEHVVTMETRPPNVEGRGEVSIRDLVINSLRMRPDRIIIGECRGGEAFDMLQAMNTGHDGSLTTLHANTPRDAVSRLETMVLMAGMDLPARAIHEQIASAVHVIVQQERLRDGSRKVTRISEVLGADEHGISLNELFRYEQTGFDDGKLIGHFTPTGTTSRFLGQMTAAGITLPDGLFEAAQPESQE